MVYTFRRGINKSALKGKMVFVQSFISLFETGIIVLLFLFFSSMSFPVVGRASGIGNEETLVSYSEFRQQLEEGNVAEVTISGERISGRLKVPLEKSAEIPQKGGQGRSSTPPKFKLQNFFTYFPSIGDERLFPLLEKEKVQVYTKPKVMSWTWSNWIDFFSIPLLILIAFLFLKRLSQRRNNLQPLSETGARLYLGQGKKTIFNDVAGSEAPKRELEEIVQFLKNPSQFQRLGGKIPRGVLLVGPPGTGKTMLARAVAGEAAVPFFSITGSDFMEMYVGVGASRVRRLFREAKGVAPSIIFIDELDSIGRHRGLGIGGGRDERDQTLNQLLSEMDGFETNESVIVMAATNRPDILDPALLRPGRFNRHITVDLPSLEDRLKILEIHTRSKPLDEKADLKKIAQGTHGFSGADLENLLNEAAILAARKRKNLIGEEDLQEARDKVIMGLERKDLHISEEERKILAYHEAGHALVAALLPHADPVYKVSIIPRGRAMGLTQQVPESEKYVYGSDYILDRLAVMMGGRAATSLVFGILTSGAEDDLKQAMALARKMVLDWGMSEKIGPLALGGRRERFMEQGIFQPPEYSEMMAQRIDEEVQKIIGEAHERAAGTLLEHRSALNRLAAILMEKEEVLGQEVMDLVKMDPAKMEGTKPRESFSPRANRQETAKIFD